MKINVDFNLFNSASVESDFELAKSYFESNKRGVMGRLWRQTILLGGKDKREGTSVMVNAGNMAHNSPITKLLFELVRFCDDEATYALKRVHFAESTSNPIPGPGGSSEDREAKEE